MTSDETGKATLLVLTLAVAASGTDERLRVCITDSESWTMSGDFGAVDGAGAGAASGGARPQTVEIMKTFDHRKECQGLVITRKQEKANFIVLLDYEGGKSIVCRDNKVAVFDTDGNLIYSASIRSLGNAVKNTCRVILGR